jgi:hypothetical protein
MRRAGHRRLWTVATALSLAVAAHAQERYDSRLESRMVTLSDTRSGRVLISPSRQTIIHSTPLKSEARISPQDDGFDLEVTLTNTGAGPEPLGTICIPGIRFGRVVTTRDFRLDGRAETVDHRDRDFKGVEQDYPSRAYSPVFVVADESAAIGVSVLYPVLDYNHEVRLQLVSPGGLYASTGRSWQLDMQLLGTLPAGQKRQYVVTLRCASPGEWIDTLEPYREFFQTAYGQPQYRPDTRPVFGCDPSEPAPPPRPAPPETVGWGAYSQFLKDRFNGGYSRVMLWNAAGRSPKPAFRFMSGMNDVLPMRSSMAAIKSLAAQHRGVGYWWGASLRPDESRVIDPNNKSDVKRALAELDLAVAMGATHVGLGEFTGLSPRDGFRWVQAMRQHAPRLAFIPERPGSAGADIFHLLGPAWTTCDNVGQAHALADLLIPGHETWCAVSDAALQKSLGHPPSPAERAAEVQRIADLGYTPVVFDDALQPPAAEPQALIMPPPPAAEEGPIAPAPAAQSDGRRPKLRFSSPHFRRTQIDAAVDRVKISTYAKSKTKPLPRDARALAEEDP